jgi:capsular polysaccharide biosynthesis protein
MKGTFRTILDAFGIPQSRLLPLNPKTPHVLEEAVLVSFCDQELHYPALMQAFATHVRQALGVQRRPGAGRRIFASRQGHPRARRRVVNWEETASVLKSLDFEIHAFGDLSARDQIQIFADADVVVGAHGSDLATLIFCQPGTRVLVLETQRNVEFGLFLGLEWLCKIFDLDYTRHVVKEVEAPSKEPTAEMLLLNRDVRLDQGALDAIRDVVLDAVKANGL